MAKQDIDQIVEMISKSSSIAAGICTSKRFIRVCVSKFITNLIQKSPSPSPSPSSLPLEELMKALEAPPDYLDSSLNFTW
ncbi:hypothetical protein SDJN03_01509, partial [Cucurbita argyrosperma subsp. sororia]